MEGVNTFVFSASVIYTTFWLKIICLSTLLNAAILYFLQKKINLLSRTPSTIVKQADAYAKEERIDSKTKRRDLYLLGLIVTLGLFFRLIWLGRENMDTQEYQHFLISFSCHTFYDCIFNFVSVQLYKQPVFNLIIYLLKNIGKSEFLLRLPSAIFGTASIFLIYVFGREILNRRVAIAAALLLAINSFHIYYSRSLEPYSIFLFFSTLSYYFYQKVFIKNKTKFIYYYISTNIICFYLHYFSLIVILSQVLCQVILTLNNRRVEMAKIDAFNFIKSLLIFNFFFISWYPFFYHSIINHSLLSPATMCYAYRNSSYSTAILIDTIRLFCGLPLASALPALTIVIFVVYSLFHMRKVSRKAFLFIGSSTLINFVFAAVYFIYISIVAGKTFPAYRHFIFALPSFILIISFGFVRLSEALNGIRYGLTRLAVLLSMFSFAFANLVSDYNLLLKPQRPNMREAAIYLKQNLNDLDAVLFPIIYYSPHFYYYFVNDKNDYIYSGRWRFFSKGEKAARYYGPIVDIKKASIRERCINPPFKRVWFVDAREESFGVPVEDSNRYGDQLEWLNANHRLLKKTDFDFITLYLYELNPSENEDSIYYKSYKRQLECLDITK